jgi:hypothetical protein
MQRDPPRRQPLGVAVRGRRLVEIEFALPDHLRRPFTGVLCQNGEAEIKRFLLFSFPPNA